MASSSSQVKSQENQTLKAYEKKVKEDVRLIHENLNEMLKLLKLDDEKSIRSGHDDAGLNKMSQAQIDSFEIQIRTANIVKSTESLSKIVSDLKDLTILNDFKSINSQITNHCSFLKSKENETDAALRNIKDNLYMLLQDLQHEYYSSNFK